MANENITSLNEAQKVIAGLKNRLMETELQIKELESRYSQFVDNPGNPLNKPATITEDTVLYIPTLDKNRHFAMKFADLCKYFDQYHYPLYFTDEESCSIFDSVFPILSDLIKFKVKYDSGTDMSPNKTNPVWEIYLDVSTNRFFCRQVTTYATATVYYSSEKIAQNCCIWMNYKYKLGDYASF